MSINKSQASALADNFLDSIGGTDDKDGLHPKETITQLLIIAGELIVDAQSNLHASNSNASGNLSESLRLADPVQNGTNVRVDILMNEYGRYVNKGVKGTESGKGLYKFKAKSPSNDMVKNLEKGISYAKKSTSNTNVKKTTSFNEKKNAGTAQAKAYGAGVNILRYGIKPTGFLDKAVVTAVHSVKDRLGAALKIDVLNAITPGK